MTRQRFSSFEELSMELQRQADGSCKTIIKEERRVEIETTDSVFGNVMPCSYPNPEQILMSLETSLECRWHTDLNIKEDMPEYVSKMLKKAYQ